MKYFEIKSILYYLHELWKISLRKVFICAPLFVLKTDFLWCLFLIFLTYEEAYKVEKQVFYFKNLVLEEAKSLLCKNYWLQKDFQINLIGGYLSLCMRSALFWTTSVNLGKDGRLNYIDWLLFFDFFLLFFQYSRRNTKINAIKKV